MREDGGEELSWLDILWLSPLCQIFSALERLSSLHPVSIIARKRLDVSYRDMGRACRLSIKALLLRGAANEDVREEAVMEISRAWLPARSNHSSSSSTNNARRHGQGPETTPAPSDRNVAAAIPAPAAAAVVAPFLSVRTAFDLYLKALKLPRGSLVVCSALTIPDMVTIFEEHGLIPVPVDLDPDTLAPAPGAVESEVERCSGGGGDGKGGSEQQRVRAIYVAHVFGAQVDMTHIAGVAARHGLLLWEDCAQVFTSLGGYLGHLESDVTFFSFGVIKRATALGGGIAHVRDAAILSAMLRHEAEYPTQPTVAYLRRVLKCSMLLACTSPLLYGIIVHTVRLLGIEHDEVVMKLSKGFPKKGLMKAIRHRACVPLLQMLAWRIRRYSPEGAEVRLRHCNRMLGVLETALAPRKGLPLKPEGERAADEKSTAAVGGERELGVVGGGGGGGGGVGDFLPGIKAHRHTLWLYPVMVKGGSDRARGVVEALLKEGFDATRAPTSLMPIDRCTAKYKSCSQGGAAPSSSTPRCCAMMDSLVYLPLANNVPDSEVDRMALALARELSSCRLVSGRRGLDESRAGGNTSRERTALARSLTAFAFRLDVIVVSTLCLVLLALLGLTRACLP